MPSNPKSQVTIIIPTVNAASELDLAISSIYKNSRLGFELLIIVDPDQKTNRLDKDILKVCDKYKLTPLKNSKNLGPYGSWNKGAKAATTEWLIFATDDQYFAPGWDQALLDCWEPKRLVAGRLVEPGIIPVWPTNLKKDFGLSPEEFHEADFNSWCQSRLEHEFVPGGFFIPMLQSRKDYLALGGYPTQGQFGTSEAVSNDDLFVKQALRKGYKFGTAEASYSYHFQASSWKKKNSNPKLSVVILTKNEELTIEAAIKSAKALTPDVHLIDSGSTDQTLKLANKQGVIVHEHAFVDFASQRNFALSQVQDSDWVLFLDADEELEDELIKELKSFAQDIYLDGVELRRKNFIFGKWIKHSDWYPDHRLVFVRPKMVTFEGDVHERIRFVKGNGTTGKTKGHLIHHNYETVLEFVEKNLISYPKLYAQMLNREKVLFSATDMIGKSLAEFMRRFFLSEGWRDGMHGLVLATLMGMQNLMSYIYLWELQGKRPDLTTDETQTLFRSMRGRATELSYWLTTLAIESSTGVSRYYHRARRKALKIWKGL